MPTVHFLLYLLAVELAYLFRLSYLGWLGPYLLAVVIFAPPLLLLLSLPAMLSSRVTLEAPESCRRGESAVLRLRCRVPRPLPLGQLRLRLEVTNLYTGERFERQLILKNVLSGTKELPLPTRQCGMLCCRVLQNERRDTLGLIRLQQRRKASLYCAVLPEPAGPDAPLDLEQALQSTARLRPKPGGGYAEEHELRTYRPGDAINSIHWKLSAKTDETIVREALIRENRDIFLVLLEPGKDDRGLALLYWLSLTLSGMELPHILVADRLYPVGSELEAAQRLQELLSAPMGPPCDFDASKARCVFVINGEGVRVP